MFLTLGDSASAVFHSLPSPFIPFTTYLAHSLWGQGSWYIYRFETMAPVTRNAREGGDSGLSKPITAVVGVASVVVGLTLG